MFDAAKAMVGQRVIQCTPGGSFKKGIRSIDIKDKFLKFGNCRFVEWLFKKLSEHGEAQNFSAHSMWCIKGKLNGQIKKLCCLGTGIPPNRINVNLFQRHIRTGELKCGKWLVYIIIPGEIDGL